MYKEEVVAEMHW